MDTPTRPSYPVFTKYILGGFYHDFQREENSYYQ